MKPPLISSQQMLTLSILSSGEELFGRDLRDALKEHDLTQSLPAFYQMMARLEDSGYITGDYSERVIAGQRIKERSYQITGLGETALREAVFFYNSLSKKYGMA